MRASILLASIFGGALAANAACNSASDDSLLEPDAGDTTTTDAGVIDAVAADAGTDSQPDGSACSTEGWCPTTLPNADFVLQDVWPFEDRAFAVGISPTLGVKVMEWTAAGGSWSYIDDDTQHDSGFGDYVGSLWAPNANELYYTIAPGYVYQGTRGTGASWTWTRHQLPDNGPPSMVGQTGNPTFYVTDQTSFELRNHAALGVVGIGAGDVYAWFTNTIFHWKDDGGGTRTWVAEYTIELPSEPEELTSIVSAGASAGEVWFAGARHSRADYGRYGSCAIVIRKGPSGYSRIADGVVDDSYSNNDWCVTKPGDLGLSGLISDIQIAPSGRIFGLGWAKGIVEFLPGATDDDWSFRVSKPALLGLSNSYFSMWAASGAEHWLSGLGIVVEGNNVLDALSDGGTWKISSIAQNGAPIRKPLYRIRGTSTSNIWAVGNGYALHKTATP